MKNSPSHDFLLCQSCDVIITLIVTYIQTVRIINVFENNKKNCSHSISVIFSFNHGRNNGTAVQMFIQTIQKLSASYIPVYNIVVRYVYIPTLMEYIRTCVQIKYTGVTCMQNLYSNFAILEYVRICMQINTCYSMQNLYSNIAILECIRICKQINTYSILLSFSTKCYFGCLRKQTDSIPDTNLMMWKLQKSQPDLWTY